MTSQPSREPRPTTPVPVTEDDAGTLSDTGTIAFNDVDLIDVQQPSWTPSGEHAWRHADAWRGHGVGTTEDRNRWLDLRS
ncbi:MAG: hypothetical protein R3D29_12215 [Nitratireductor sp.]